MITKEPCLFLDQHITVGEAARPRSRSRKRPANMPQNECLDRLLGYLGGAGGAAPIPFACLMFRREARELRRVLLGSKGLNSLPEPDEWQEWYSFDLPKGWQLRLKYLARGYEFDGDDEELPPNVEMSERWRRSEFKKNERAIVPQRGFGVAGTVLAEFLPPALPELETLP